MTIRTLTLAVVLLSTVAAVAETTYKVRKGDTLRRISQKYGVSVDALRQANHLDSAAHLSRGQILNIPTTSDTDAQTVSTGTIGKAEVIGETAIPHAGPFDGSKALDPVPIGTSLTALDTKPGWVELQLPSGIGWLSSDAVKLTPACPFTTPLIPGLEPAPKKEDNGLQKIAGGDSQLLKKALTYQGVRYRWGGTSRSSGVDCSGFTTSVFLSQGIKLPRTSIEQSHIGKAVAKSDLKPGDLVFFRTSRAYRVNHVGIYVGEGKFIHAATGAGHVMVSSLGEKYYLRCYAMARRVADFEIGSRAAAASRAATEETELGPSTR